MSARLNNKTKTLLYDPTNPRDLIVVIQEQSKELTRLYDSLDATRAKANQKLTAMESHVSLCPQASDVDTQLSGIYLNLFAGVYSELIAGMDMETQEAADGRVSRLLIAHENAMGIVSKFREEILSGTRTDTKHADIIARDIARDIARSEAEEKEVFTDEDGT